MVGAVGDCFGFSSDLGAHQVPLLKILVWKVEFARLLRDPVIAGVFCSIVGEGWLLYCSKSLCWFCLEVAKTDSGSSLTFEGFLVTVGFCNCRLEV